MPLTGAAAENVAFKWHVGHRFCQYTCSNSRRCDVLSSGVRKWHSIARGYSTVGTQREVARGNCEGNIRRNNPIRWRTAATTLRKGRGIEMTRRLWAAGLTLCLIPQAPVWGSAKLGFDWTFDGTNGQTTNLPEPVNNNTGTVIGVGSISTMDAAVGSAAFYRATPNGNNDRIALAMGHLFFDPTTEFSVTGWIKTSQASYPNIFGWSEPSVFACELRLNGGLLQTNQYFSGWYNQSITGTTRINDSGWHFVALTRQFSGGTSLFVDGNYDVFDDPSISAPFFSAETTYLAGHNFNPNFDYSLDGWVDDISYWGYGRLSETELKSLRNLGLSALDYNAMQAALLFDVYAKGKPATTLGRTWIAVPAGSLVGLPGSVVAISGGQFGLVLGADGSGVISRTPILGDFSGDGTVDASDYILWRDGLGTTYTSTDYTLLRFHFGESVGSGATSNIQVPEPSSAVTLALFLAVARRQRRSIARASSSATER